MMKIGSVNCCGITYTILKGKKPDFLSGGEINYGITDHLKAEIHILDTVTPEMVHDTLLHEIQHALWHNFEELFIRILTPHLVRAMDTLKVKL